MAYSSIVKPSSYFNTKLFTGNGGTQAVTGVGFQPDWVWLKSRSVADSPILFDAVRGATKRLMSNAASAESTEAQEVQSFDSDGFTVGNSDNANRSGATMVGWNWKAGTTGSGNTGGSGTYKAYSYSVNTTAGFSIVKYVGNGTGGHTIPHHLGVAPSNVIIKDISASNSWISKMKGYDGYLYLNNSDAGTSNSTWLPTDANNLTLANTWGAYNTNDATYIAYCFAEKTGYSKFGSYTGNGNADGSFIYTGGKPAWVMIKKTNDTHAWRIYDGVRDTHNLTEKILEANTSNAEATSGTYVLDLVSNGFKFRGNGDGVNGSGQSFIYMAFGQTLVGSNNIPATAR